MNESKRQKRGKARDKAAALTEMDSLLSRLDEAYANFNRTTDPDAMDACIYEISALRSRYNTALKHYRLKFFPAGGAKKGG